MTGPSTLGHGVVGRDDGVVQFKGHDKVLTGGSVRFCGLISQHKGRSLHPAITQAERTAELAKGLQVVDVHHPVGFR